MNKQTKLFELQQKANIKLIESAIVDASKDPMEAAHMLAEIRNLNQSQGGFLSQVFSELYAMREAAIARALLSLVTSMGAATWQTEDAYKALKFQFERGICVDSAEYADKVKDMLGAFIQQQANLLYRQRMQREIGQQSELPF